MKTEELIDNLEELSRLSKIGLKYLQDQKALKKLNLEVGNFIKIEKTKDVPGIIYNKNEKGNIYVVLGMLNGNLHVKGINNKHWGYLHIEHVEKFKKLNYTDL